MFESVLRRVLQAVFGVGSDISVTNPLLVSQANIDEGNPLPVGGAAPINSFEANMWHGRTLNDILTGRYAPAVGPAIPQCNIDDYKDPLSAVITLPTVGDRLYLYSRRFFDYPDLHYRGPWADRTGLPDLSQSVICFEGVGALHTMVAGFRCRHVAAATNVYAPYPGSGVDPAFPGYPFGINLAAYLPGDYMTAVHYYACKLNKGTIEYRIDNALVLAAVMSPDYDAVYSLAGPPYDIVIVPWHYNPFGMFHLHLEDTNSQGIPGFSDGEPLPLRTFPLYTTGTNTQWKALATAGAVLTSHPVPVWGYGRKTLLFQADAAGNLDIQVYSGGGWRSWVPGGITLVANQLEVYNLNGEVPLARCVYTPTNADTITLAEVCLGGE